MLGEIKRVEAAAAIYEESQKNGGGWIGEREGNHMLWDQAQLYDAQIADAHNALIEVRKAFIIMFYHHWENSVALWRKQDDSREELVKYCIALGYPPHPELDAVRHLTNHMKYGHNSNKDWLGDMNKKYPLFLPQQSSKTLSISEEDIQKISVIILESGSSISA